LFIKKSQEADFVVLLLGRGGRLISGFVRGVQRRRLRGILLLNRWFSPRTV